MAMISTQRQPSFLSLLVLGEFVDADALLMSYWWKPKSKADSVIRSSLARLPPESEPGISMI
jgi:hypothetical protein